MVRAACGISALLLALGSVSSALFAHIHSVPARFENVRALGTAVSEFKNDRIQIVVAYEYAQVNHGTRWLLIGLGALGQGETRMTIDRDRIRLVAPVGRVVPHATHARLRGASDLDGLLAQLTSNAPSRYRLDWYLSSIHACCTGEFRFFSDRPPMFGSAFESIELGGPHRAALADLLFESPSGSWDEGRYALVVSYDRADAMLPIELR